ncbi:nitrous oxide reductase accessory protein NosL [Paenibacillus aquistagni]|uniref:Copper chaperone NosL n=1 Tax=Paenibacillus aquistagni TaxID=1852522 RepID=A0A1X7J5F7_9BACL|nr:copper chaperone NosL [Paenibacillus aquistagni]
MMKNKSSWGLFLMLIGMLVLLAACGGDKYVPQAINEETDVCVICKMAVKDDQFATQIVTKDGQSLKFDDIGCLNKWKAENGTDTIGAAFVRDYHSKEWIPYEKAYYAYDASYKTPMAYGIVSFEKEADAKAFIEEEGNGKLMTANQLDDHSWERNRDMMEGMGDHGHSHGDKEDQTHDMPMKEDGHSTDKEHETTGGHNS